MTYISQQSGQELTEVSCRTIYTTDDPDTIDIGAVYVSSDVQLYILVAAVQVAPGLTQVIMQGVE